MSEHGPTRAKIFTETFIRVFVDKHGEIWLPAYAQFDHTAGPAIPHSPQYLRDAADVFLRAAEYAEKVQAKVQDARS